MASFSGYVESLSRGILGGPSRPVKQNRRGIVQSSEFIVKGRKQQTMNCEL